MLQMTANDGAKQVGDNSSPLGSSVAPPRRVTAEGDSGATTSVTAGSLLKSAATETLLGYDPRTSGPSVNINVSSLGMHIYTGTRTMGGNSSGLVANIPSMGGVIISATSANCLRE